VCGKFVGKCGVGVIVCVSGLARTTTTTTNNNVIAKALSIGTWYSHQFISKNRKGHTQHVCMLV
jgi:hypothetical protein